MGGAGVRAGRLTELASLDLHGNQLTGPIPRELGSLTALTELSLQENQLVRFHENRPFERSKLLTFFLREGAPGGAKIPTSQFVVCKLAPNNQPGKPGNRYHVVAAHPSKNCETWFIFHWDFTKIDPLNKANC